MKTWGSRDLSDKLSSKLWREGSHSGAPVGAQSSDFNPGNEKNALLWDALPNADWLFLLPFSYQPGTIYLFIGEVVVFYFLIILWLLHSTCCLSYALTLQMKRGLDSPYMAQKEWPLLGWAHGWLSSSYVTLFRMSANRVPAGAPSSMPAYCVAPFSFFLLL